MYKNFNNYEIFEDGKIWSKTRNKWMKPQKNRYGYLQVGLCDNDGKIHTETVHKVVFFAVNGLWEYPEGYEINHIDENKENNHISNLELVTAKQNINWGTRTERMAKTKSKKVAAYNQNGELMMVFDSIIEAQSNGYNQGNVSKCCLGKRKTHKGFIWKYLDEE